MQTMLLSWAVSVTAAILLGAMLSMILPESGIKKYIKVVLGIVVTLIILTPLLEIFSDNDIRQEIDNAIDEMGDISSSDRSSQRYTDYILDVYEVYIGDE